jgi:hypothetical protein
MDVVGIGAGPAGVLAASRAAELGARTVLVTPGLRCHGGERRTRIRVDIRSGGPIAPRSSTASPDGIAVGEPILDYHPAARAYARGVFPIYAGIVERAAYRAARQIYPEFKA